MISASPESGYKSNPSHKAPRAPSQSFGFFNSLNIVDVYIYIYLHIYIYMVLAMTKLIEGLSSILLLINIDILYLSISKPIPQKKVGCWASKNQVQRQREEKLLENEGHRVNGCSQKNEFQPQSIKRYVLFFCYMFLPCSFWSIVWLSIIDEWHGICVGKSMGECSGFWHWHFLEMGVGGQ